MGKAIRVEPNFPPEKWTTAIVALKPRAVVRGKFGIYVFTEPDKEYLGYYVFITAHGPPDSRTQIGAYDVSRPEAEMDFQETGMKRIYKFMMVPIL